MLNAENPFKSILTDEQFVDLNAALTFCAACNYIVNVMEERPEIAAGCFPELGNLYEVVTAHVRRKEPEAETKN